MEHPTHKEMQMNLWMMDYRRFPEMQANADLAEARRETAFEADRTPTGYYHNQASQYNSAEGKAIRAAAQDAAKILFEKRGYDVWGNLNGDGDGPPYHPNCRCD